MIDKGFSCNFASICKVDQSFTSERPQCLQWQFPICEMHVGNIIAAVCSLLSSLQRSGRVSQFPPHSSIAGWKCYIYGHSLAVHLPSKVWIKLSFQTSQKRSTCILSKACHNSSESWKYYKLQRYLSSSDIVKGNITCCLIIYFRS